MSVSTGTSAPLRALYLRGCALVLLAGLFWSFTGLLVRLTHESDAWQYLLYRSTGAAAFFGLASLWAGRGLPFRDFLKLGLLGWVATLAVLVSSVTFIFALKTTTIANALFLSASQPLQAGLLAWLILGEKLNRLSIAAIVTGFAGVVVMIGGDTTGGSAYGNVMAFSAALAFAFYIVCLRHGRDRDFSPTMFIYALAVIALASVMIAVNGRPLVPPLIEIAIAIFNGFVFIGIGSALYIRGSVHVPAAGLAVLSQTESVFGPLWVALVIGETPGLLTIAGGVIILSAVIVMAIAGASRPPPQIAT